MTLPDPIHFPPALTPQRRRRRWWSLSVRGLMLLVLVVGGLLGLAIRHHRGRRAGWATILAAGGYIEFQDEMPNAAGGWVWLYRQTGIDFCREERGVLVNEFTGATPKSPADPTRFESAFEEACAAVGQLGRVPEVAIWVDSAVVTRRGLARLAAAPIDSLILCGDEPTTVMLTEISRLRLLKRLTIALWGAYPHGEQATFEAISSLPQLEALSLSGYFGFPEADKMVRSLAPLGRMASLREIAIDPSPSAESCLAAIDGWRHLTSVTFKQTQVTDAGLSRLGETMPQLTRIHLDGILLTDRGVAALTAFPHLESVALLGEEVPRRRNRRLGSGGPTDASLRTLGGIRTLKQLRLGHGSFTDAGVAALADLPLTVLDLEAITACGPGLARLLAGRQFDHLGLHGAGITDAELPLIVAHLRPGAALDLSETKVTDAGMRLLATLNLRELNLELTGLTDAGLAILATSTIPKLVLWDTKISAAGIAAFQAARPGVVLSH